MTQTPILSVGILLRNRIEFTFHSPYRLTGTEKTFEGHHYAIYEEGSVTFEGEKFNELAFVPVQEENATFTLKDVTIGIDFHWERDEDQTFEGCLSIIIEKESLRAINKLSIEAYLRSVISSEMSATSSMDLLKAHTVISRSWVLSQVENKKKNGSTESTQISEGKFIKWYDRDDHIDFDVCADDHCQRYQGITRITAPLVKEAVESTRGEVLTYDDKICDARFSKCCGGVAEKFESCWQEESHPYLVPFYDHADGVHSNDLPADLTNEEEATKWIMSDPEAFCNTQDKHILQQVLNHYDQETADFYRWKVVYTQAEIQQLINTKAPVDFGEIIDLIPVKRGPSGRLIELKIVGTKATMIIGKELEIRKVLSNSHLYSSAFVVERTLDDNQSIPTSFTLYGAGWGHGAGLCQIGAAVMSEKGYDYQTILNHYFRGSTLQKRY